MKAELREALRQLAEDELLEVRDYVDRLLAALRASGASPQGNRAAQEKRRFERYSLDFPVNYLPHSAARRHRGQAPLRQAVARDISRSGVRLLCREALRAGERLSLYLPRATGTRKVLAQVTWCRRVEEGFECGARFLGFERLLAERPSGPQGCQVVVACEPGPQRAALRDLLVKDGYYVVMANGVPEVVADIAKGEPLILVASPAALLADEERLLRACEEARDTVVTIAIAPACEPEALPDTLLARCHDHISDPQRPEEVLMVVERAWRRLAAAGRRGGA